MSEPKGRGDAWTEFVPPNPPQARRRSDEGRQHLKSAPEASGGTLSTWHDLVTASLIGTERAGVPAAGIPGLPPTGDDTGDPAAVLLDRAALLTAARRAGRQPDRAQPLAVCEPDPRPAVNPAAADRLARLLSGEYPDLLSEWLRAVSARGLRLPAQFLPVLLDRVRRVGPTDTALARLVAEAGGPRARWLAGLNPDWEFAAAPTPKALTGEDAWRLGDAGQRRGYLASLLATDPDAARDLVRGSWDAAAPAERVMFLSALITQALVNVPPGAPQELEALRQLARRADPALAAPDALPRPAPDAPPVLRAALRVLRFRYDMLKELDE
jgi:hypothetical protein